MLLANVSLSASKSQSVVGWIQEVMYTMHWLVLKSGQEMSTLPEAGSLTSDALPPSRSYLTTRPVMPLE